MDLIDLCMYIATSGYLLSTAAYLAYLVKQKNGLFRAGLILMMASFAVHSLVLVGWGWASGHLPVHNLRHTLSMAAWSLALAFLICQYRFSIRILGATTAPLVAAAMSAAVMLADAPLADQGVLKSFWLYFHVVAILLGDAALALACGAAILYLMQERAIKTKRRGFFFHRLPSLERLDAVGYATIGAGFSLLTVGLITGAVYAQSVWGRYWSWDPKEVWSVVTWLIYAALLHQRLTVGWRGRRAAVLAILGFAAVLFTFLGVNLLMKGHHGVFTRF